MDENEVIKCYEKEIEIFLATIGIYKGNKIYNTDPAKNTQNKKFIIDKMIEIKAGNVDKATLEKAVDKLLPYLYEK
ncbi:MAG: hypothetical protein MR759_01385 [Ruminococcus sp.]|nr:hypothetical protein [Ruminococcus sp.]